MTGRDCVDWLADLIKKAKEVSTTDLSTLRDRFRNLGDIFNRDFDEVLRKKRDYHLEFINKCVRDEYAEGYFTLAELKLRIASGQPIDEDLKKVAELIEKIEKDLVVVRRLKKRLKDPKEVAEKIAEYYHDKITRKKEGAGFFGIVLDAVHKGKNVIQEIMEDPDIPDPMANIIDMVYGETIALLQEAAKVYIDKYGLPQIEFELENLIDEARKKEEEVKRNVEKIEREYEKKLKELYDRLEKVERQKAEIERKLAKLEEVKREEVERIAKEFEKASKIQNEVIRELMEKLRVLEDVKRKLEEAEVEIAKTVDGKKKIEEELKRIEKLHNELRREIELLRDDSKELLEKKRELEAIVKSLREENVTFDGVTREEAKVMEMDYVKLVESRLKGWKVKIFDEREKIYRELKSLTDITYDDLTKIPNNIVITATQGLIRKKVLQIRVLSHYKELFLTGVDRRKFSLSEILPLLDGMEGTLVLASTTGWSEKAIEFAKNTQQNVILVDLRGKEVYYNPANLELKELLYYIRP